MTCRDVWHNLPSDTWHPSRNYREVKSQRKPTAKYPKSPLVSGRGMLKVRSALESSQVMVLGYGVWFSLDRGILVNFALAK